MIMKEHLRPLVKYRIISGVSCFVLVLAFILFLLVGLSLPIIKPVYLLALKSTKPQSVPTSVATELLFGVWGVCASSALIKNGICIGPQLGYQVPVGVVNFLNFPQAVITVIQQALLVVLVLHPVAAGLVFIAMFASLFLHSHAFSIFVLILTIISALVSSVVLAIDLALVIVARNEVTKLNDFSFEILFGNGVWMMVVAVAAVWLAVILLSARACYCCGVRRTHHHDESSD